MDERERVWPGSDVGDRVGDVLGGGPSEMRGHPDDATRMIAR
jgi:hypothetical protein